MPVDWRSLFPADPNARLSPFLADLAAAWDASSTSADRQSAGQLRASLADLHLDEQLTPSASALTAIVAGIVRIDVHEIDDQTPLTDLGLDSLMAVEIKNRLQHDLAVDLPLVQLLEGPSISQLTASLLAAIKLSDLSAAPEAEAGTSLEEIEI